MSTKSNAMRKRLIPLLALLLAFIFAYPTLLANLRNLPYLDPARPITTPPSTCRQTWLQLVRASITSPTQAELETILSCAPAYVPLLAVRYPTDLSIALLAVQSHPGTSEAWFWLGEAATAASDAVTAQVAYQQTVTFDPRDGLAWCRLGRIHENQGDPTRAQSAYLNCCTYGDPGSNGCYGAGRMAEQLNQPQQAIQDYRNSRWEGAHRRADELEAQLSPRP
jgi:tetratricopeptide (TPR) repeat protein